MSDVEPRIHAMVIREMIRRENDLINHRIMWLLVVQGLIANAYVSAGRTKEGIMSSAKRPVQRSQQAGEPQAHR